MYSRYQPVLSWSNNNYTPHHHYFSTPAAAQENTESRRPSALTQANLPQITPGHAIRVLQIHAAKGRQLIRQSDFHELCQSSRPGKKRDAKVIRQALRDFKRCNKYILSELGARLALEGMMRAMIPFNHKIVYGYPKVEAAGYALSQITEEMGLYYCTEIDVVDQILEKFKEGLDEMIERGTNVRVDMMSDDSQADEEETNNEVQFSEYELNDRKRLKSALKSAESAIQLLIKRRYRPENDMKKRAKRKYLKHLKTNEGPQVSTMTLATQISLAIGGVEYTQTKIIDPYKEAWWTRGEVDESVLQLIADVVAKEEAQKAALEAAAKAEHDAIEAAETAAKAEQETAEENDGHAVEGDGETESESAQDDSGEGDTKEEETK